MKKALGIDFGEVRIGLATSDDIGLLAHPYQTISGKAEDQPIEKLAEIIIELKIADVVIGLPLHSDGRESTISKRVKKFVTQLKAKLPEEIPIHQVDELMTTKIAREKIQQAQGKRRLSDAELKKIIDQAAAVEILQDWINQNHPQELEIPPDWLDEEP